MVAVLESSVVVGAQVPRIRVVPDGVDHPRWSEVEDFVRRLGMGLDEWQWDVLRVSLLRQPRATPVERGGEVLTDQWAAFAVGLCCPRQNGKNEILQARELAGSVVLGEELVIHTAHLTDTAREAFRRVDELLDANEWLSKDVRRIWRTNGLEQVEFRDGRRIKFRTRTRGGGRGFAGSPVKFDEAMFLPLVSVGSIMPVISAQPDPQIWYTGSAVDQTLMDDAIVFARVRERALRGDDPRLAYFEWSLDVESPDRVEDAVASDPASWAATNPALGLRISPEYVAAEQRELDPRTFAVERLGVGDWPATDGSSVSVIDLDAWRALVDPASSIVGPACFAYDVAPDRSSASISAAGRRADGLAHVEVIEHRSGTGWVTARLVELCSAHESSGVLCDASGPAASLVHGLEEAGVSVRAVNAKEHANACGLLFDLVEQEGLRHLGSSELVAALKGAATRPLGDAWAWARKRSSVDIAPLVSSTLAVWGAFTVESEAVSSWRPL